VGTVTPEMSRASRRSGARPPLSSADATVPPFTHTPTDDRPGAYPVELMREFSYLPSLHETSVAAVEDQRLARPWVAPIVHYAFGDHYNPVTVAQFGLGDYTRYLSTGDSRFLDSAASAANWLLEHQDSDGAWRVDFAWEGLPKGWTSAMYQGQAMSLLCRVYLETGQDKYLDAAKQAYRYMIAPIPEGALGRYGDGGAVLEEYPGSTVARQVLNGTLFAIWGIRDLSITTADPVLDDQWRELASTVAAHLPDYDTGSWSAYAITAEPSPAPAVYHGIHVAQMHTMYAMTNDERWAKQAALWEADMRQWARAD